MIYKLGIHEGKIYMSLPDADELYINYQRKYFRLKNNGSDIFTTPIFLEENTSCSLYQQISLGHFNVFSTATYAFIPTDQITTDFTIYIRLRDLSVDYEEFVLFIETLFGKDILDQ